MATLIQASTFITLFIILIASPKLGLAMEAGSSLSAKQNLELNVSDNRVNNDTFDIESNRINFEHATTKLQHAITNKEEGQKNIFLNQATSFLEERLEHGFSIDYKNSVGHTLLHYAALIGAPLEIFNLLLSHAANANIQATDGATALHYLSTRSWLGIDHVKLLLNHKADINTLDEQGRSALHKAIITFSRAEMIKFLLDNGANADDMHSSELNSEIPPLHLAIILRNFDAVKLLVDHNASLLKLRDKTNNYTPLQMASFMYQRCLRKSDIEQTEKIHEYLQKAEKEQELKDYIISPVEFN